MGVVYGVRVNTNSLANLIPASIVDMKGQRFGRLLIVQQTEERGQDGTVMWKCRCDCGNERVTDRNALQTGNVRSCGCLFKDTMQQRHANNRIDLKGSTFGFLTYVEEAGITASPKQKKRRIKCKCTCGNECVVDCSSALSGKVQSCGCYHRQIQKTRLLISMVGTTSGRLTVIGPSERRVFPKGGAQTYWQCLCECGETIWIAGQKIRNKETKSCGCLKFDSNAWNNGQGHPRYKSKS